MKTYTDGAAEDLAAVHQAEGRVLQETTAELAQRMAAGQLGEDGPWLIAQTWKQGYDRKMAFLREADAWRARIAEMAAQGLNTEAEWRLYPPEPAATVPQRPCPGTHRASRSAHCAAA